jgi:hypothetical protein
MLDFLSNLPISYTVSWLGMSHVNGRGAAQLIDARLFDA